ncbi:MAG: hypothetical protein VX427_18545 [Acidobacteriota bacterium]|nr:hypothetical protein [Acidobacteriota bacterium]
MTPAEIQSLVVGLIQRLGISSVFLVVAFLGFCVIVGFTKHRVIGKASLVVRSLDDRVGSGARFLAPDAPRGPADQLHTPELLEQSGRQVS